jgi:hypothetical protein
MPTAKETTGDVIKINITPKSTTFPWIRIFRYPKGIRSRKPVDLGGIDANQKCYPTRASLASAIGEAVIKARKVLSKEYRK